MGQKWTDCTNATKKCINCVRTDRQYTDHLTLAANLPRETTTTIVTTDQIGPVIYKNRLDKTTILEPIDANYLHNGMIQRKLGLKQKR